MQLLKKGVAVEQIEKSKEKSNANNELDAHWSVLVPIWLLQLDKAQWHVASFPVRGSENMHHSL